MNRNNTTYRPNLLREETTGDIDIRGLLNVMQNHKNLFVLIMVLGTLLTFFATLLIKTNYTARSSILIYGENAGSDINISTLGKALSMDIGFILTEIEVLKSRSLIKKVVHRLNLTQDSELNGRGEITTDILDTSLFEPSISQTSFKTLSIEGAKTETPQETETINNFLNALSVSSIPGSLAIKINFTSKDPSKAALITNSYVDEYIKQRLETKYEGQIKLGKWLDERVIDLQKQILESETRAEEFRAANNLTVGKRTLLSAEELSNLSNQYVTAKTNYLDLKNQFQQVQKGGGVDKRANYNSINSSLIKNLNVEKIALETSISELSSRYGPKHPTMIKKQAELTEIKNRINQQIQISKDSLKSELAIAKAQLNEIEKSIKQATDKSNLDNSAMITLRELERETATSNNILKTLLEKYKRISGKNALQDPGARVISYANIPTIPSSPDKRLILALGIFVSFILGLAVIFLKAKLYNKFRTAEDLEKTFNIPFLGSIPYSRGGWGKNLVTHVLSNPSSPITEAIRDLRIGIKNYKTPNNETPKVISILSSVKNEGKTTIAILMAALASKAGERVILIDTNLRIPSIHDALKQSNNNNLVDYLTNQKELKDIIHKDKDTGLDIIFGNSVPNNAFNLLSMNKLDVLIEALRQNYDLVIIDTPACLTASDARLIEQLSDFSLYCVKSNKTKDKIVTKGIKPFISHNNQKIAFVLTQEKG